jgi:SET domain-containing protein
VPHRKYRIGRSRTGLGLFAAKPFKKREYIVTYRGRRIRNAEADRLEARGSRYMFEINSRWTIDGSRRWNTARYVNHSCRPNAEAIERRGPIIVYCARRRIKPDEEITVDYGKDYFAAFIGKTRCQCPKCRERRAEQQAKSRRKRKRLAKAKSQARKRPAPKRAKRKGPARKGSARKRRNQRA